MGVWEFWIFLIIAAAVWIVGHLLRQSAQLDERREPRRPGPGERRPPEGGQRRPPARTELDRFLQEVNRRKQMAEQQGRGRPPGAAPAERRPARPRTVIVERPAPRRVQEPIREVIPVEPARSRPAPARRAEPVPVLEVAEVEAAPAPAVPAAPPSVAPVVGVVRPLTPGTTTAFPTTGRRGGSGAIRQLAAMLRSKDNLCAAMMLREVLDRPLAQRHRR